MKMFDVTVMHTVQGGIYIFALLNGRLCHKQYFFMTVQEAKAEFCEEFQADYLAEQKDSDE